MARIKETRKELQEKLHQLKKNLEEVENYERWGGQPRAGWKDELKAKIKATESKVRT